MPRAGDHYIIYLKQSHLDWGRHRYTHTRDRIAGEGYVPIPKRYATAYGINIGTCYMATFADGFPPFTARAAGNSARGELAAKQFQGDGDLKAFGRWFAHCGAETDDAVVVTFTSPQTVNFELIKR